MIGWVCGQIVEGHLVVVEKEEQDKDIENNYSPFRCDVFYSDGQPRGTVQWKECNGLAKVSG